jgi:DNA polymerase sigma
MLFINGHAACKYDLNNKFLGKRRMQYNLGDAPLGPAPSDTKTRLDKDEDEALTKSLKKLYNELLPSPESEQRRARFIAKLEDILRKEWPGTEFKAHVFGSSGNMLYTSDSDGIAPRLPRAEADLCSRHLHHNSTDGTGEHASDRRCSRAK